MRSQASPRTVSPASLPDRRLRVLGQGLLVASGCYALASTAGLRHPVSFADAATIFSAAAIPGLLVIMLLWTARPRAYPRGLRQLLTALTLAAAAVVAAASLIVTGS